MRNSKLKDIRQEWKDSRFFIGKNKVLAIALGRTKEDECRENLHRLSKKLSGQMVVLFTNRMKEDVAEYFLGYHEADFSRSGNVATQTVRLAKGPLNAFPHSMEPQLRQLGLPTALQKGIIHISKEYTICKKGDTLTPEQARILKMFGHQMADFHLTLEGVWHDGKFESMKKVARQQAAVDNDVTITATDIAPTETQPGTVSVTRREMKKRRQADLEDGDEDEDAENGSDAEEDEEMEEESD